MEAQTFSQVYLREPSATKLKKENSIGSQSRNGTKLAGEAEINFSHYPGLADAFVTLNLLTKGFPGL